MAVFKNITLTICFELYIPLHTYVHCNYNQTSRFTFSSEQLHLSIEIMTCFLTLLDQMQRVFCLPQRMLCMKPTSCTENIINYFAFCPPPPSYSLYYDKKLSKYQFGYERKPSDLPHFFNVSRINEEMEFALVKTKYYGDIACMYYAGNPNSKLTILYSHGNSCDLGDMVYLCVYLAKELKCNILAYDYSGYGCSSGKPSEKNVYADVEAAALHLVQHYGLSFRDIVLYGQSLGCSPTVDLATRINVRGVVIQSGFTSAIGVPFPKMQSKAKWCDQFKNIDRIGNVTAPTLIIHGTEDKIVNVSHGVELFNKCPTAVEPLWIEGAGHVNIESYEIFSERLKSFLDDQLGHDSYSFAPKCKSHTCTLKSQHSVQPQQSSGSHGSCCRHSQISSQ